MPELPLALGMDGRPRLGLPLLRLVNAYSEPTPSGPTQAVRTRRPGLTLKYNLGVGPILRSFQQPGIFGGADFNVAGGSFFMNDTNLGEVAYSNNPRMCASNDQLSLVCGGALYVYQKGALQPITTFDDGYSALPPLSTCAVLYNITLYMVAGSNQFFYSSVGDATTINAANFSQAQTDPSPGVELAVLAEEVYVFKQSAVEIWDFSGQLNAPFSESPGRTYARGCAFQASVVKQDNALFWVGDDLVVYRTGAVPIRVSTNFIEDQLRAAANADGLDSASAFAVSIEGHAFVVINLPQIGVSYALDCQTKQWAQWGTGAPLEDTPSTFIGTTSAGFGENTIIGSAVDGRVWKLDERNPTDDGQPIRVIIGGALWSRGGNLRNNNVSLAAVRGQGGARTPGPAAQMRWSDDGGKTFTSWFVQPFGGPGDYRFKTTWRNLGMVGQPGRLYEFSFADEVTVAVEGASYNEARV